MPPHPSPTYERLQQTIARRILGEDVTQIDYSTERVKRMVGKVLTGNGITAYGNGAYSLIGGDELSDTERDELQQLCRQRLDTFREQRGEEVFAYRSRNRTPISDSVNYRVLTRARGRCECCAAHEHQRALEVDHIIPRNQGGSDAISNLQALCFRGVQASYDHREMGSVFCALEGSGWVLLENEGHSLVIPRRQGGRAGAAPAGVERRGGAAEAAAGAAECPGRHDQRLGWFAQRKRGAELRGCCGADGVSFALAPDYSAGGGLRESAGRSARGD